MFERKRKDGDGSLSDAGRELSEAYEAIRSRGPGWSFPSTVEYTATEPEPYDPADYTDSGELAEALKAVANPGVLGGRVVVPTVIGFYYGGSPVVARLGDDNPGSALGYVLGDVLRRVASAPLELADEPEPDPDVVETTKRNAQLAALRQAAYAVGHPDGSEAWRPHQVIEDMMDRVRNGETIE